jgi:hypothetical protein
MLNLLTKEGDLKGQKMESTHFGSNCPSRVNEQNLKNTVVRLELLGHKKEGHPVLW